MNCNFLQKEDELNKDTSALEKVQKFGLRICSRNWNASYQELLDTFHLPSLENRRLYLSLSTFFKIIHNLIYFPSSFHPSPVSSSLRCNHAHQYCIPFARTNHFKQSLLSNSIYLWNHLPIEAFSCTTLPMLCINTVLSHFLYVLYNSYTGYTVILAIRIVICVPFAICIKFHKRDA